MALGWEIQIMQKGQVSEVWHAAIPDAGEAMVEISIAAGSTIDEPLRASRELTAEQIKALGLAPDQIKRFS